ncbi:MAG: type II toxin-antitoxin system RatA family toxin [Salaquimonas sp.]|nr:type II toxin-antitoxin system RatA family toxin [Salaquimonas sp.]
MPQITRIHPVSHSAQKMFDLVADVEQYPQFLPLCEAIAVRERRQKGDVELLVSAMTVGYKAIRETFTTRVLLNRPALIIDVSYVDGPFKRLDNRWRFEETGPESCNVHFHIDYEFASRMLGMVMGAMFEKAFRRFTAAFEERARVVYGPPRVGTDQTGA